MELILVRVNRVPSLEEAVVWVKCRSPKLEESPARIDSVANSLEPGVEGRECGREATLVNGFSVCSVEKTPVEGPSSDHGSETTVLCIERDNPKMELEGRSGFEVRSRDRALVTVATVGTVGAEEDPCGALGGRVSMKKSFRILSTPSLK